MILKESIRINGKDGKEDTGSIDTTMQEKNITYPTDSKLHRKIIKKCHAIADKEGLQLRQSYSWTLNGWVLISASESIPETVRKPAVQTAK